MINASPTPEDIEVARQQLSERIAQEKDAGIPAFDRTDAVTDMKRTPFLMAMRTSGYTAKLNRSGCQVLESCPLCRGSNRHTFTKGDQEIHLCSDCGK